MLKRFWFVFISLLLICISSTLYVFNTGTKEAFNGAVFFTFLLCFLGISIRTIQSKKVNHNKLKNVYLIISATLLVIGILSRLFNLTGSTIEIFIAIMSYCFLYAPLQLYFKYNKWREYSNNNWEILVLSFFDFAGINMVLVGVLSKLLNWPGQLSLVYAGIGMLIIGLISWNIRFKQEVVRRKNSEDRIKKQYIEIEKEKKISNDLLLNILPTEVAEELKIKGTADAKQFDEVTILFTDFKDFTKISEKMTATELVEEIDICFKEFDKIIGAYGIEKIKTIGDSYMCAGGLPVANNTHALDVVSASLEIQKFIQKRVEERRLENKETFQIRIGIHTGPVVAGIVGLKKFAYDIWGDAVNTASRIESAGEVGKVNISETTYLLVKDKFKCIHRGKIQARGKGEIDMYFVEENNS